jgi:predicted Zn-dependent protease with MMP-like domain
MRHSEFDKIVEEALDSLPEEFSRKLENVDVVVEDEPSQGTLRRLGLSRGGLLGLYHGVPLKKRSIWSGPTLPDKISIYRIPILAICRTKEEMRQRIREVVIHEVGHHFGLSDREMNRNSGIPSGKGTSPVSKQGNSRQRRRK